MYRVSKKIVCEKSEIRISVKMCVFLATFQAPGSGSTTQAQIHEDQDPEHCMVLYHSFKMSRFFLIAE
jgi:hypothetical protein